MPMKQEIVEKGGLQPIVGILCRKNASREILCCANYTVQTLVVWDEITKKGLLCCECILPILGMLSYSWDVEQLSSSACNRVSCFDMQKDDGLKTKDQRMRLTTRISSDIAEA